MKSRVKFEAVATVGTYKDRHTGEEKKQYLRVGTMFEAEDGRLSLKLDAIPCGPGWSGYIQFFEPKPKDEQRPRIADRPVQRSLPPAPPNTPDNGEDDDIPF